MNQLKTMFLLKRIANFLPIAKKVRPWRHPWRCLQPPLFYSWHPFLITFSLVIFSYRRHYFTRFLFWFFFGEKRRTLFWRENLKLSAGDSVYLSHCFDDEFSWWRFAMKNVLARAVLCRVQKSRWIIWRVAGSETRQSWTEWMMANEEEVLLARFNGSAPRQQE